MRKGKGIAIEARRQLRDDDEGGEESPENTPTHLQKRQKTSKSKGKKVAKGKEKAKKSLTPSQRATELRKWKYVPTKWADHELMDKLGINQEVDMLFQGMGLGGILNMAQPSHKEETIQFISSLTYKDETSNDPEDQNRGIIEFKVHGKKYSMPIIQLPALYNLPRDGEVYKLKLEWDEALAFWKDIAKGSYVKGGSKSSCIRHPALRYAHIILAHTLFARKEKGNVLEEELALLVEGIKQQLVTTTNGNVIVGQTERINYARFLVRRLLKFQASIDKNEDAKPSFHFGGIITPILNALGVRISKPEEGQILRIGTKELVTNYFLAGMVGERFAYRFESGTAKTLIILPNQTATTFVSRANILFHPGVHFLHDPNIHGPVRRIARGGRATSQPVEQQEEEVDIQCDEPISGSKRYKFSPYTGVVSSEALRHTHNNMNILHRFIKWHNKTIKNMVERFRKQRKQIKELQSRCLRLERRLSIETAPSQPSTTSQQEDVEESSNAWRHAPISPTSSGSGNPAYSLGSASDEN